MSQDPEQQPRVDEAPDPQYPYGATPQAPSAPLSYISPEFYTAQPNSAVEQPLAQSGYTVPTPRAYQAPPVPQYGVGSNYGHGGQSQGYVYSPQPVFAPQPQATPLSLGEAIRQLPAQYWRVLSRPSSTTFAAEMGKARWNIVWAQIALYIVLTTVLSILANISVSSRTTALSTAGSGLTPSTLVIVQQLYAFVILLTTYGQVLLIPLSLFIGTGLLFMLAKAFGGVGKFLPQLYCSLLFIVPLGLLLNVLSLLFALLPSISFLSIFTIFGYWGYEGVLLGLMLISVHRLSGGRATGAIFSFVGVALLLFFVLGFVLAIILTASLPS